LPPSAQNLTIIAIRGGVTQARFETASTFRVQYDFDIDDDSDNSVESGTLIRWFVNNILFKQGTFSDGDTFGEEGPADPREIVGLPNVEVGQESDNIKAHEIGNEIKVEVTPKTALITGEVTLSDPFFVVNSLPIITEVTIFPPEPKDGSGLQLSYTIDDPDIDIPDATQTDQSEIKWIVTNPDGTAVETGQLDGEANVPDFDTSPGQKWTAEVTGFDGLDLGNTATSNTVIILPGP